MEKDYGAFLDTETVRFERILPGTVELVWSFLTESEKKATWLSAGDVEPRIGGKVEHRFDHTVLSKESDPFPEKYADLEKGAHTSGTVTEFDPPHLLAYTWDEGDTKFSEVTFELTQISEDSVRLILIHTKLGSKDEPKIGVGAGWHTHLNILRDVLSGTEPQGFWKVHMPLEKEYAALLPRS